MSSFQSYTLPMSPMVKIMKESDFALETKDTICIFEDKCTLVLFYTESEQSREMLNMYVKVGGIANNAITFGTCNVELEKNVATGLMRLGRTIDHPFSWTGTKQFPFIIVFRRGYPIWFYEGPPDVQIFSDFVKQYACNPQFNIYNIDLIRHLREQMRINYNMKHPVTFDGVGSTTGRRPYKLPAVPYTE